MLEKRKNASRYYILQYCKENCASQIYEEIYQDYIKIRSVSILLTLFLCLLPICILVPIFVFTLNPILLILVFAIPIILITISILCTRHIFRKQQNKWYNYLAFYLQDIHSTYNPNFNYSKYN